MPNKIFTLGEFADAIEKNGLEWTTGYFFRGETKAFINSGGGNSLESMNKIGAACAVGQGLINLGVDLPLRWVVKNYDYSDFMRIIDNIVRYNDSKASSFEDVARFIRTVYSDILNTVIGSSEVDYTPYLEQK